MSTPYAILLAVFALIIGAGFAWLVERGRASRLLDSVRNELGKQLNTVSQERAQLNERAARIPELQSRLSELERMRDELIGQAGELREIVGRVTAEMKIEREALVVARSSIEDAKTMRTQITAELHHASVQVAELSTQLDAERRQSFEKINELKEVREYFTREFQNLANEILEEKSKRFTEQNRANLGQLLDPLQKKLVEFQTKVETVYDNETRDRTALGEQVRQLMALNQSLSDDAKNLTSALKGSSKTQGSWGELILERVLESAGLRKGEEYDVQESHASDDGTRRPDVTIHLPEDRHMIIDSKVSLTAYEEYAGAENDDERTRALKRHMESVRNHMRGLSDKNYQDLYGIRSLDFVLMFVPIEPAFMLAVTQDRNMFMDGWQRNVLMVSPSTLLFVVRTVAHLWRQESQNKNAQEIAKRGAELYDRLCNFVEDLEKVGGHLDKAKTSFNDARDKLARNKGNVIRQAEMLKLMGVKPNKSLPARMVEESLGDEEILSLPSDEKQGLLDDEADEKLQK